MNFLLPFIIKYRSILLPIFAVLAVTVPLSLGVHTLGKQSERLGHLTEANKQWAKAFHKMQEANELERQKVGERDKKLDGMATLAAEDNKRLKDMERQNAEVKALLDTRVPDDLKRLLDRK